MIHIKETIKIIIYQLIVFKPTFIKHLYATKNTHVFVSKEANFSIEDKVILNCPERHDIKSDRGIFRIEQNANVHIGSLYTTSGSKIEAGKNADFKNR